MVKSCSKSELDTLLRIVKDYADHMCKYDNRPDSAQKETQSFLVRIYGAYILKLYDTDFRFFVMENLFNVKDAFDSVSPQACPAPCPAPCPALVPSFLSVSSLKGL